jgi:hypothetical protein
MIPNKDREMCERTNYIKLVNKKYMAMLGEER